MPEHPRDRLGPRRDGRDRGAEHEVQNPHEPRDREEVDRTRAARERERDEPQRHRRQRPRDHLLRDRERHGHGARGAVQIEEPVVPDPERRGRDRGQDRGDRADGEHRSGRQPTEGIDEKSRHELALGPHRREQGVALRRRDLPLRHHLEHLLLRVAHRRSSFSLAAPSAAVIVPFAIASRISFCASSSPACAASIRVIRSLSRARIVG